MRSAGTQPRQEEQPSVVTAVERVFEASQRVVLDRLDLVFLEFQDVLKRTLQRAAITSVGVVLVFCGWVALSFVLVLWLERYTPEPAAIGIVGALNLGAGVVLLARVLRFPVTTSVADGRFRRIAANRTGEARGQIAEPYRGGGED